MTDYVPNYRIVSSELGHEPQMSFLCKGGERWVALNLDGFWADAGEYSSEHCRVRFIVSDLALAQQAIIKARAANGTNISTVK